MKTLIEGGDIVAHDGRGHRLLRNGALVFEDDRIAFVGRAVRRARRSTHRRHGAARDPGADQHPLPRRRGGGRPAGRRLRPARLLPGGLPQLQRAPRPA